MGNSASRSARTLLKDITAASPALKRSQGTQLPPQALRDKFHASPDVSNHPDPDPVMSLQSNAPGLLGKDGLDPHEQGTSSYDSDFTRSINSLGKQIVEKQQQHAPLHNSVALRQVRSRQQLFAQGEHEAKQQESGKFVGARKTVSPRTMTDIIRDSRDNRLSTDQIASLHDVSPVFVRDLGKIFKVASTVKAFEEDTAPDQLVHKARASKDESDEYADSGISSQRLAELKKRINLVD